MGGPIRAAGGVVRRGERVAIVHRPKYDDWSLPKGKLEDGESDEDAALREVLEETGLRCTLGRRLRTVRYRDGEGRPKEVAYWEMTCEEGELRPTAEVDDCRWVDLAEARSRLHYDVDRELVSDVLGA